MANNFLPGVQVTLNDLGLKIAPPPAGPKVTLLGITSNTGVALREPFTVASVEKAINTLFFTTGAVTSGQSGRFPGELALAMEQAAVAGATNIEVMIIGHYSGDSLMNYISPTGNQSGRYIDLSGAYAVIRNRDLDVVVPVGARMDYSGDSAGASFGKQLADFCYQATSENNACIGVISPSPVMEWAWKWATGLTVANTATGISGVYPDKLSGVVIGGGPGGAGTLAGSVLSGEIQSLFGNDLSQNQKFKNMLFATPSLDLVAEWYNYHTLALKADFKTFFGTTGDGAPAIGFTPYVSEYSGWLRGAYDSASLRLDDAKNSTNINANYFPYWQAKGSDGVIATDARGIQVDAGAFVNVFTTPVSAVSTQTTSLARAFFAPLSSSSHNTAGSPAYAGLINALAPQSSPTNKFVRGLVPLRLLSATQANVLTGLRHVTMYSRSKGFVVTAANSGAHQVNKYLRSDYAFLTTVRITHSAVDLVRAVAEKYLGEPNNAPQLNALNGEIEQVLLNMKNAGALIDFDFVISSTPDQRVLGELDINLTMVPAFEIRKINLNVSLSKGI